MSIPILGRTARARKRPGRKPIEIGYSGPLQVGAKQITIKTRNIPFVGVAVYANTPPNYPWYDAETKDNLAVNAAGEVTTTVNLRAVGDKIKVFGSTGPASRDFTIQAESPEAVANPNAPTPPPVVGTGNAAAIFAKMGLGINQERFTAVAHGGARSASYYQYYRDLGFKNVRFFIPAGFDSWMVSPFSNAGDISGYLDAVQACVDSGMPVSHIDGMDVVGDWQIENQPDRINQMNAYVQMFAAAVAARNFPVDRVIVGAINEYGGTRGNAFWEPHRIRTNGYLRAALPNHTIVEGPSNWKDPRSLFDPNFVPWDGQPAQGVFNKWNDSNTIIDCHHYLGWDAAGMDWVTGQIKAWGAANNRPVYMGEYGFGYFEIDKDPNAWITRFDAETQYENVCVVRPCLWAVTDGSSWPMNNSGTNTMRSDVDMAGAVRRWSGRVNARIGNATPTAPTQPTTPPTQGSGATLNILVRGQSNAYYFVEWGNGYPQGAYIMQERLKELTGRDVKAIFEFQAAGDNTIYSGSNFLDWDTDGKQAALLRICQNLSPAQKAAPFVELWLHNEDDQKDHANYSTADWVREVRADAALVRNALGLTAAQHLRYFVPIRYPYGDITKIRNGMDQLAADGSFNARVSMAAWSLRMDGGPEAGNNSSHMGPQDARDLAENLAQELAALFPSGGAITQDIRSTGTAPPPPPSAGKDIVFNPTNPNGAASWNTTLAVTGMPKVSWVVQNDGSHNPPWSFEHAVREVAVPANGQVPITVVFNKSGQFVQAFDTADNTFARYSESYFA